MSEHVAAPNVPTRSTARDAWRVASPVLGSSVTIGALLACASFPITASQLLPDYGLDPSWQAALAMAAHRHLHFGTEVVWTYGPLGFLTTRQLYYPLQAFAGLLFHVGIATAIFAVILAAVRRYTSLPLAIVVAYAAGFPMAAMWGGEEALIPLAFVVAVRLLSRPNEASTAHLSWITLGGLTALAALDKPSVAAGIGLVTVIALAGAALPRRAKTIAVTAAAFAAVFLAGWFATGNRFGNVVAYVRSARESVVGYQAMALDPPAGYHRYLLVALLVMATLVATSVWYARRLRPVIARRTAVALVAATVVVNWVLFKEGYVRQAQHQLVLFASVPIIICAFANGPAIPVSDGNARPVSARASRGPALVVTLLASTLIAIASFGSWPHGFGDPISSTRGFVGTLRGIVQPHRRHNIIDAARAAQRAYYAVPAAMLTRIGRGTVDIDPIEQSVAWAYPALRWQPLPTLQSYFAYTGALDDRDVDVIGSTRAPQYILRERPWSIDGRRAGFDAPATRIAIECNYAPVASTARWQLVEHHRDRCSAPRDIGVTHVRFGETVTVPSAARDEMVVARFELHLPWWRGFADMLYKSPMLTIRVDGNAVPNRFVAGTAGQPHLLARAATSDYRGVFRGPRIHTIVLGVAGSSTSGYSATITFAAIRVR